MSGDFCSLLKEQREKEAKAVLRGAGGDISLVSYTGFSPLCVFKCAGRGGGDILCIDQKLKYLQVANE